MPQLMPLYWCFSIFILLYIFVVMMIMNENVLVEEFYGYNEKLNFSLSSWMW